MDKYATYYRNIVIPLIYLEYGVVLLEYYYITND